MKYRYLILITSALLALSSCKVDSVENKEAVTELKSVNDLELFANSFYGSLGGATAWGDDNTDVRLNNQIDKYFSGAFAIPTSPGDDGSRWGFSTIRETNYFLEYATNGKITGDPKWIEHYTAEGRFFRALEYSKKIAMFGDYPWQDRYIQLSDEMSYNKRDTRAFVIDKILEDLDFACTKLLEKKDVKRGRIYNFVAYAQLARFCLYEGTRAKYAKDNTIDANKLLKKAVDAAKYIMDNGGYSITLDAKHDAVQVDADHKLSYQALFTQLSPINGMSECILSREYAKDLVMHNVTRQLGEPGSGMTKAMINQYLCTDGKPIAVSPLYKGDECLDDEIANRDLRLFQTIDNKFLPYTFDKGVITVNELPIISGGQPTGYNIMKFHHTDPNQWIANACWTQWFLYRYAETLLIYAEAKAELGTITQSDIDITINKLRERAGVAALDMSNITTDPNWRDYGYTLSPLLHEIRRERSVELMAEGFRYDDIFRWRAGKLLEDPLAVYGCTVSATVKANYPNAFDKGDGKGLALVTYKGKEYIRAYRNLEGGYKWNDKYYLRPIPTDQFNLNPNLKPQNPGWE